MQRTLPLGLAIQLSHAVVSLVRKYKGKTPNVRSPGMFLPPSFDTVAAEIEGKLVPYPSSHSIAKENVGLFQPPHLLTN